MRTRLKGEGLVCDKYEKAMATVGERSGVFVLFAVILTLLVLLKTSPSTALPTGSRRQHEAVQKWQELSRENDDLCFLCKAAVDIVKDLLEKNSSVKDIYPVLEPLCVHFLHQRNGYNGEYMCPGIIYSYVPVVLYVVAQGELDPEDICYLIHLCNSSSSSSSSPPPPPHHHLLTLLRDSRRGGGRGGGGFTPHSSTNREIVETASDERKERGFRGGGRGGRKKDGDPIVFLQISDIHLDPLFNQGSPSVCNLYLCCRNWYNGTGPAGYYGDFNCDLPLATLDVVVEAIAELDPQPDFIIYTGHRYFLWVIRTSGMKYENETGAGDNTPHNVWNETTEGQDQVTQFLISYLTEKLPSRSIYPALGNHETYPESEYIGTLPQYQELTKKMAGYWEKLVSLPQSALDTITDGAYYTVVVQDKLRILSFNSDYGYTLNFYSRLNDKNEYFTRQQKWILDTLQQAETAGEKVIMMAHIPPGDPGNTLATYEEFYLNLTKRYRDTIVAHLFGHTHHDEFILIQDEEDAYGTVLICPSVTPYSRSNPSFRLFSMDSSSYQLLNYHQFHLNLSLANEQANKGVKPQLELAYTTTDLYDLQDLTPPSYTSLVERFSDYPELVSDYQYNRYGQTRSGDKSCDQECIKQTVCGVSNILSSERKKCLAKQ